MTIFDSDFTVGIEEELFLVDATSGRLRADARELVARIGSEASIDCELYATQIEIRSGKQSTANAACDELGAARHRVAAAGATVLGAGLHPTSGFGATELATLPRYAGIESLFAGLFERSAESALHVHVGMPDADTAIRVLNGLREYLPLFIAAAANSPWWFGRDSKMRSARYGAVRAYPTRRVPDRFASFDQYSEVVASTCRDAELPDATYLYWDIRINPKFGTIEVREMDAQYDPHVSGGLAAFIQALAVGIAQQRWPESGGGHAASGQDELTWSCFRAARDGLQSRFRGAAGAPTTAAAELERLLVAVRPISESLGSDGALEALDRLIREGNGADQQLRRARSGEPGRLMEFLISASNPSPDRASRGGRDVR